MFEPETAHPLILEAPAGAVRRLAAHGSWPRPQPSADWRATRMLAPAGGLLTDRSLTNGAVIRTVPAGLSYAHTGRFALLGSPRRSVS